MMSSKRSVLSVAGSPPRRRAFLTDDLSIEILSRLPTKSLYRFQCISEHWRTSVIPYVSSQKTPLLPMSGFFICHMFLSTYQSGIFVPTMKTNPGPIDKEEFTSRMRECLPFNVRPVDSCNGLMLLVKTDYPKAPLWSFSVWNPTTMELLPLPKLRKRKDYTSCCLAYDPRLSPHYKVVQYTAPFGDPITTIDIYSSTTGTWTTSHVPRLQQHPRTWEKRSVFHKGAVHWMTNGTGPEGLEHLIRLDLGNASVRLIKLPQGRPWMYTASCIGESRGHLYYAVNLGHELQIYMMLDDQQQHDKWVMTHKTSTELLYRHPLTLSQPDRGGYRLRLVAFHSESELIYLSTPCRILLYHPSSGRLEEVCRLADHEAQNVFWMYVFPVAPCLESICPPGGKLINKSALEKGAKLAGQNNIVGVTRVLRARLAAVHRKS